jgi:hypothetical protein
VLTFKFPTLKFSLIFNIEVLEIWRPVEIQLVKINERIAGVVSLPPREMSGQFQREHVMQNIAQ